MPKFTITPIPKPRMTRSDKWNERPVVLRYRAFRSELQKQSIDLGFSIGQTVRIIFFIPMPDSWANKKKATMDSQPHQQTPDIDNLIKAVLDSLLPDGDSVVWFVCAVKVWSYNGGINIHNLTLAERSKML